MYCDLEAGIYHNEEYMGSSECDAGESHMSNIDKQESGYCIGTFLGGFVIECSEGPCEDELGDFPPSSADLIKIFERQQKLVSYVKYGGSNDEATMLSHEKAPHVTSSQYS